MLKAELIGGKVFYLLPSFGWKGMSWIPSSFPRDIGLFVKYICVWFRAIVGFSLTCVKSADVNRIFKTNPRRNGAAAHLWFVAPIMVCFTKRLRWGWKYQLKYIYSFFTVH